jgi:PAS domain S-box-containing protein
MYGYSAQEMVGQSVTRIFLPGHLDEFTDIMERICRGERIEHFETQRQHKDGHILDVSVSISPIMDKHGTVIGASAIARNIGKQKELERQREAFVGLVTHELRNPLAALQGNVQVARRLLSRLLKQANQLTEDQQQMLQDVLTMLGRSQQPLRVQRRLIDDLLDLSRIQQDQVELCLDVWNLDALVHEVVQDHQAAYPNRLITLEIPDVDPLPVYADRDRITQVLGNYITNALKFAPEDRPIQIGIDTCEESVCVWVKDHGPGLSAEQREHIWERFSQVAQTPRQGGWRPGLGLGLYLCQQLISRQGGKVGVESVRGQGATFWFSLPLHTPCASLPGENEQKA